MRHCTASPHCEMMATHGGLCPHHYFARQNKQLATLKVGKHIEPKTETWVVNVATAEAEYAQVVLRAGPFSMKYDAVVTGIEGDLVTVKSPRGEYLIEIKRIEKVTR